VLTTNFECEKKLKKLIVTFFSHSSQKSQLLKRERNDVQHVNLYTDATTTTTYTINYDC